MQVRIKNCGLMTKADVHTATTHHASFIGLVHYAPSPRHLPLDGCAQLANAAPANVARVIVTVNPNDALLQDIARTPELTHVQVHGVSDAARLYSIAALSQKKLIVGVSVASAEDVVLAHTLEEMADHLLLDSKSEGHGGSGASFDWQLLKDTQFQKPWFLAGGLHAGNVAQALAITLAPMVDVSSGIEEAPGKKSAEKIAAFHAAVLSTRP